MTRHGYSDELDNWALIRWRGRVASAMRGKRGQKLLRDMRDALDAMPEKRLIAEELIEIDEEGGTDRCALGVVAAARGVDVSHLDSEESDRVAEAFDIAEPLAREITYQNDEAGWRETPEQRWVRMRNWVEKQIK